MASGHDDMPKCSFCCTYPEYLLDRTLIINGKHEHKVSGYKLANASEYFKKYITELRSKEIERSKLLEEQEQRRSGKRVRTRSVSEIITDSIEIVYDNLAAFEFALSFVHTNEKERDSLYLKVLEMPSSAMFIGEILKVAEHFRMKALADHTDVFLKQNIGLKNCWSLWSAVSQTSTSFPDIESFCKNYLLDNFIEAAEQAEQVAKLSFEELIAFLHDDRLQCRRELSLLNVINFWIDHDIDSRLSKCRQLLESLRLGRLTHDELNQICLNEYVVRCWEECESLIVWSRLAIEEISTNAGRSGDSSELLSYIRRPRLPSEAIFVVGGWEGNQDEPNFGPSPVVQVYDCRANEWTRFSMEPIALDEGHAYSGCVLIDKKIFVVGGYTSHGPTQTLKMFDCRARLWRYMAPMHEKRNYICVARLDESIFAIGGHNGRARLNSVERYDLGSNSWSFVCPMLQTRSDAGADSLSGRVYVCGGFDGSSFYRSVEMYDPIVDQWTAVASMRSMRSGVSVAACGGYLYSLGGNNGQHRLNSVERYDPETNRWSNTVPMQRQRSNFCVTVLGEEIYVMGGWSDESQSTIALVECYSTNERGGGQWRTVKDLHLPASANCCCVVKGLANIQEFLAQR